MSWFKRMWHNSDGCKHGDSEYIDSFAYGPSWCEEYVCRKCRKSYVIQVPM